jgi:hypothetical protein
VASISLSTSVAPVAVAFQHLHVRHRAVPLGHAIEVGGDRKAALGRCGDLDRAGAL